MRLSYMLFVCYLPYLNLNAQDKLLRIIQVSSKGNDSVEYKTPEKEKIVFSKKLGRDSVYRVRVSLTDEEVKFNEKGTSLVLENGKELLRKENLIEIKMTKNITVPFKYVATFELSFTDVIALKNFRIKSYKIGSLQSNLSTAEQTRLKQYFNSLVKVEGPPQQLVSANDKN